MKKILYYSDCYIFGGCENIVVNLLYSENIRNNYELHFAYAWNSEYQAGVEQSLARIPDKYPVTVLNNDNRFYRIDLLGLGRFTKIIRKLPFRLLQISGLYNLYNLLRLLFLFKKLQPDLLHINNGGYPAARSCLVAVLSAKLAGVPKIVFNVNNQAKEQKHFLEKLFDRYIGKQVDCFITASSLARSNLISRRGIPDGKIRQIFNAMQQETVVKGREELLAEFNLFGDSFVLVTVAFLTERKGQIYLLAALKKIRDDDLPLFERLVLFLVGDGEDRLMLENYIHEHDLANKVVLTGNRRDYYDFINAADLFILPSIKDEDMPLVNISAMGLGKTIVSTKVAGIIEEIRDGVDGVLIDPEEMDKLANVIIDLYNNEQLRTFLGASALQRYRDFFSVTKVIEKYNDIYREVMDRAI